MGKPPYAVPSMAEIAALPPNGYTAVTTFSGCGGSSLGYRMAGFRMVWASEFVPAAADTYRANAAPYTVLDRRDIREVTGAEILEAAGLDVGEIDLFDGSPPCASFSTSGKRDAGWGKVKKYSDTVQRTDDLFYEYARLIRDTQPRTFVAENVSGLVKGTAKGYFIRIMTELRACGYRVEAKLLDAAWLGVPQTRQRLIFVGVRNDLGLPPAFPAPLTYRYAVRDVLPHIVGQGDNGGFGKGEVRPADLPSGTIGATPQTGNGLAPPSLVLAGRIVTTARFGEGRPRVYAGDAPSPTIMARGIGGANADSEVAVETTDLRTHDPETGKDLRIGRYAIGRQYEQLRRADAARGNVVARKFTLLELRRICGFPDDFTLTGTYEQRWERLGRAVPPVMMSHIAAAVRDRVLAKVGR